MARGFTLPGIGHERADDIERLLQDRLVGFIDLQLTLKHIHWNLVGPQFIAVHEMLDDFVEPVREMSDGVAERIAMLGGVPVGTPGHVVAKRDWEEYPIGRADTQVHLAELDRVLEGVATSHRAAVGELDDLDLVTQDLLIAQLGEAREVPVVRAGAPVRRRRQPARGRQRVPLRRPRPTAGRGRRQGRRESPTDPFPGGASAVTTILVVRDVESSVAWYRDGAGAEVARTYDESAVLSLLGASSCSSPRAGRRPTSRACASRPPATRTVSRAPSRSGWRTARAAHRALSDRGADFLTPPLDRGGEIRCFLRDPDGHLFELSEI